MSKDEAFKAALAAEETFKAAVGNIPVNDHLTKAIIADMQADNTLSKVIQTMKADEKQETREQEDREAVDNLKGKAYNTEPEPESKPSGGFATLCVLGAAALAVAVPYLINKFKKED
jgi:hypothetical protein